MLLQGIFVTALIIWLTVIHVYKAAWVFAAVWLFHNSN